MALEPLHVLQERTTSSVHLNIPGWSLERKSTGEVEIIIYQATQYVLIDGPHWSILELRT